MQILLNNVNSMREFVNTVSGFRDEVVLEQDGNKIDGKSVVSILNIGIENPFTVSIKTNDKETENEFYDFIKPWKFK